MPVHVQKPVVVQAAGNKPKLIREFFGRPSTKHDELSVAQMKSPQGWVEPGQRPDFDEFTVVIAGRLHVEHEKGALDVRAGEGVLVKKGEWVRYSTPDAEGAEYVAVCLPAFTLERAHRDS
jgi:mannose-6-phosphate isomerase-like protein (cupin superfamily)